MTNVQPTYADVFHEFFPHIHGDEMEIMLMEYTAYPMCGYDTLRERLTELKTLSDERDQAQSFIERQKPTVLKLRAILDGYEDQISLYLGQRQVFAGNPAEVEKFIVEVYANEDV